MGMDNPKLTIGEFLGCALKCVLGDGNVIVNSQLSYIAAESTAGIGRIADHDVEIVRRSNFILDLSTRPDLHELIGIYEQDIIHGVPVSDLIWELANGPMAAHLIGCEEVDRTMTKVFDGITQHLLSFSNSVLCQWNSKYVH